MGEHRCLYCRAVRPAGTVEHFIPERLGWGHPFTLPVGAVCDRCQNWASQDVDPAIWTGDIVLRTWLWWFQVPGKRGRLGRLSGDTGDMFDPKAMSATMPPDTRTDNDKHRDELFFSRAVHKMALGAIAWDLSLERALDPIFDPVALTMRQGAFLPYGRAIGRWVDEGAGIAVRVFPGDSIVAIQLYAVTYWAFLARRPPCRPIVRGPRSDSRRPCLSETGTEARRGDGDAIGTTLFERRTVPGCHAEQG